MNSSSVSLGRNLVSLKWEEFNIYVLSELAALYQKDDLTDVTLFCEGRSFRAHRVLLSLWSSYFRDVFRGTSHSHPVVILKETNSSDLELILRFIYQGHLLIPIEDTERFLKTAEHFQIAGLKNMRSHVPSYTYSRDGSAQTGSYHAHGEPNSESQQEQSMSYNGETSRGNSAMTTLASPLTTHSHDSHQQTSGAQFKVSGGGSLSSAHNNLPQQSSTTNTNLGVNVSSATVHSSPTLETANHHPTQIHSQESNNQHQPQVIRQGLSRAIKHLTAPTSNEYSNNPPSTLGFLANSVGGSPAAGGIASTVGVLTRVAPESVIYQSQPVLIFQNEPPPPLPPSKQDSPYITRENDGSRLEHPPIVVENVVGSNQQIHIEAPPCSSSTTTAYSVYADAPVSLPQITSGASNCHESSPEVSSNGEEILGLPYGNSGTSPCQNYPHHREAMAVEEMEMEPESVVVTQPYSLSSSSYNQSLLQNGSTSNSPSSSTTSSASQSSQSSTLVTKHKATAPNQSQIFAVKRLPPPLSPSSPPSPSRNYKSTSTIRSNFSTPKRKPSQELKNVVTVATRSKSSANSSEPIGGYRLLAPKASSSSALSSTTPTPRKLESAASTTASSRKGYTQVSACASASSTNSLGGRKIVLVPCPKCGKKVKQTSLKVHMKRTHLEEGTILVCPVCSKRISSKGVYYKHMYLHRKRSETANKSTSAPFIIKNEGGA